MLNVDEFESVFRAADKKHFAIERPSVSRVLVVHDLDEAEVPAYLAAVKELLAPVARGGELEWVVPASASWSGVQGVLNLLDEHEPDLLVSYRNLNSDAFRYNYSLGVYLNALTRATKLPVVVTPNPKRWAPGEWTHRRTDKVMVVEDHLTGDDALINWGLTLVQPGGELHLAHVENDANFERFIKAISKVPEIDTAVAREKILEQLLREPREYIATCAAALVSAERDVSVREHVVMAHRVADYRALIEAHGIHMLVFPALEEDALALNGNSYSLAVELVDTPLLML